MFLRKAALVALSLLCATGAWAQTNVKGGGTGVRNPVTVGTLPTAAGKGRLAWVSDGAGPHDCSTGGASPGYTVLCCEGASAWAVCNDDHVFDVRDYGASPSATASDNRAAIQAAIDAAQQNGTVYIPAGTFQIDALLTATTGQHRIVGAGANSTIIQQNTDNVGIIALDVGDNYLADMTLYYANQQTIGQTAAIALDLRGTAWSVIERVFVDGANTGIGVTGTDKFPFSISLRDMKIAAYTNHCMDITPSGTGGISGNVLDNIYCLGRNRAGTPNDTSYAVHLGWWSNGVINQLNIENTKPTSAIWVQASDGIVFNGLHFETLTMEHSFEGFVHLDSGSHVINNMDIWGSTTAAGTVIGAVRAGLAHTKVQVNGLNDENNTINGTKFEPAIWSTAASACVGTCSTCSPCTTCGACDSDQTNCQADGGCTWVYPAETGTEFWFNMVKTDGGFTSLTGTSSSTVPSPMRVTNTGTEEQALSLNLDRKQHLGRNPLHGAL